MIKIGGRGARSSKGASAIKATNAKFVENMNEAQIQQEINKIQNKLDRLDKQIDKLRTPTQYEQFMAENFPLGAGQTDKAGINRLAKSNEKSLKNATQLKEALAEQETANKQLKILQNAQKQVQGTGKTQKEIQAQKEKSSIKNNAPTRKWSKTQKESFTGGGLTPQVMQSGDYKLVGKSIIRIYKNNTLIGQTDKMSKAKAFVEAYDKKQK